MILIITVSIFYVADFNVIYFIVYFYCIILFDFCSVI